MTCDPSLAAPAVVAAAVPLEAALEVARALEAADAVPDVAATDEVPAIKLGNPPKRVLQATAGVLTLLAEATALLTTFAIISSIEEGESTANGIGDLNGQLDVIGICASCCSASRDGRKLSDANTLKIEGRTRL